MKDVDVKELVQNKWIVTRNKGTGEEFVYDVSKYESEHPGDAETMKPFYGKCLSVDGMDATAMFEDVGHSNIANEIRDKHMIGRLKPLQNSSTITEAIAVSQTLPEDDVDAGDAEEEAMNRSAEYDEEQALARALSLPKLLAAPSFVAEPSAVTTPATEVTIEPLEPPPVESPPHWPPVFDEETELLQRGGEAWPDLNLDAVGVQHWIRQHGKILVRTVTWNLAAKPPPAVEATATQLLPRNRYHLYVISTEECERSIATSAINPSKKAWEEYLCLVLGQNYVPLRAHTLQAIHIIAFAHRAVAPLCTEMTSAAVATGIANTLGNKGGVALSISIGTTKFVFASAHLAAHQNAVKRRNAEYNKLRVELPALLAKKETKIVSDSPSLETCADRVVFMGDLNYRVRGNRDAVDQLLRSDMHDVMLANDQLMWSMRSGLVLTGFTEPPLNFRPTYKFDFNATTYDQGPKRRIPAWADRILYVDKGMQCLAYNAEFSLQSSDHRPVYATFFANVDLAPLDVHGPVPEFTKESQVCTIF